MISLDVLYVAVVAQAYKVDVEVTGGASRGCTAILRCIIPSYVKDLVRVVSWLHEPSSYIYPSLQGGKCTSARTLRRVCDAEGQLGRLSEKFENAAAGESRLSLRGLDVI